MHFRENTIHEKGTLKVLFPVRFLTLSAIRTYFALTLCAIWDKITSEKSDYVVGFLGSFLQEKTLCIDLLSSSVKEVISCAIGQENEKDLISHQKISKN